VARLNAARLSPARPLGGRRNTPAACDRKAGVATAKPGARLPAREARNTEMFKTAQHTGTCAEGSWQEQALMLVCAGEQEEKENRECSRLAPL